MQKKLTTMKCGILLHHQRIQPQVLVPLQQQQQ